MRGLRILLRDDRETPFVAPVLREHRTWGVLLYEPDLSTAALTDSLAQEAADPAVPAPERMTATLQLAALDYAYSRFDEALEKYGALYTYYEEHQVPAMQAMCLDGVGRVLQRMGRLAEAKARYQQGLALLEGTQALPAVLNLAAAAGEVSLALSELEDAEGYFDVAERVAAALMNPYAKADAMEHLGEVRLRLRGPADAQRTWTDAATLCRATEYWARLATVLERQRASYAKAQMDQARLACEEELALVRQALGEATPS
jgi:tetratricopeptide (TPR) repeat protein